MIETKKELFIFQLLFFIFFNEDIKFEKKKRKKEKKERNITLENLLILHLYAIYFSWILQETKIVLIFGKEANRKWKISKKKKVYIY